MAGVRITVDAKQVGQMLRDMYRRTRDLTPAMKLIGETIWTSVMRNFEVGGRPKWAPHSEVTKARTRPHGVLGLDNHLMNSISYTAGPRSVEIGTNRVYAAVQQFGQKKGASGRTRRGGPIPWGDIPARPYMTVQGQDWTNIYADLTEYVMGDAG